MTIPFPSSVQRARTLLRNPSSLAGGLFSLSRLRGRVCEISQPRYGGLLSALMDLLLDAQQQGEQIAWVAGASLFFPPDLAFRGLDVQAITVILPPTPVAGLQACETLLRSGAFGVVVVDWAGGGVEESAVGRLARLCEDREATVVFLTKKKASDPSVATQVSLRGVLSLGPTSEVEWSIAKDKRFGPPCREKKAFHGPFGLY